MVSLRTRQVHAKELLFLLVMLLLGSCHVISAVPDIEVSIGFDNLFVQDTNTSLAILVRSPDAPMDADLVVEYHAGTALERKGSYQLRRRISLPGGLSGVYRFTLPLKASTYPLSVRIEKNGVLVARKETELRPMVARGPVVAGLSRRPSLDSLIPGLTEFAGRQIELRYPRVEYLPADSRGWDGVNLVVWHDLSPDELDDRSAEALSLWLASGGLLVVVDGPWLSGTVIPENLPFLRSLSITSDFDPIEQYGRGQVLHISDNALRFSENERDDLFSKLKHHGYPGRDIYPRNSIQEIVTRVSSAAFHSEEGISGKLSKLILFPGMFGLVALGIFIIGMKLEGDRNRWLQIVALVFLSLLVSAVIRGLPVSKQNDPVSHKLNITLALKEAPAIEVESYRQWSPRGKFTDLPLKAGQLPVLSSGRNVSILYSDRGSSIEELETGRWNENWLSLQSINRPSGSDEWIDLCRISEGKISLLAEKWSSGDELPSDSGRVYLHPTTGIFSSEYLQLAEYLAGQPGNQQTLILGLKNTDSDKSSGKKVMSLLVIPEVAE